MDATTVKLQRKTKQSLDSIRAESESYDRLISRLIAHLKKRNLQKELAEAYKNIGKQDMKLLKEWEQASVDIE